jgi:membrane associated rhomboid family serine protease
MDRLLARLERRFGKLAIDNLAVLIVGGMAIAFIATRLRPEFENLITLDLHMVLPPHWQAWRLFTYLFIPKSHSMFWILFELYWVWLIGSNLDSEWGAFKFNVYYLVGMLGTTLAAALTSGVQGNLYLNMSLFLAFATLFPDYQILAFLILPVKVKWLAWLDLAFLGYEFVMGAGAGRAAIVAALANYLLFFGGHLWGLWKGRGLRVRQAARRVSLGPPPASATGGRTCAICGALEDDGADIRVCSCAKCGGTPRMLCLPHARNH